MKRREGKMATTPRKEQQELRGDLGLATPSSDGTAVLICNSCNSCSIMKMTRTRRETSGMATDTGAQSLTFFLSLFSAPSRQSW